MKQVEKKLETILEKNKSQTEKFFEIQDLEKISQYLETLEKMAHVHVDDKDFLKALKKLKSGHLLENLKSAYDPAFSVLDLTDIKEKILAWLKTGEKGEGSLTLGGIFQAYLKRGES